MATKEHIALDVREEVSDGKERCDSCQKPIALDATMLLVAPDSRTDWMFLHTDCARRLRRSLDQHFTDKEG